MKRTASVMVVMLVLGLATTATAKPSADPTGTQKLDSRSKRDANRKPKKPVTPVPEPGALLLFGGALVAGAGAIRRKA